MSPQAWMELSSWGLLIWAISATVLFVIQLLAWPDDIQKIAAISAVFTTGAVIWRIWMVYRFGWALGGTEQGIIFFMIAAVSWLWLAYTSWSMNRGRYGWRIRRIRRNFKDWQQRYR